DEKVTVLYGKCGSCGCDHTEHTKAQ
ncbi:GapA-binding peptide SR1P, partial [Bacillus cereus group sp. BfR-BA-01318]